MLTPLLDDDLGLGACTKPFHAQALVAEFAVEAFVAAILPRLARIDVRGVDASLVQPFEHSAADELGAVVRAQVARRTVNNDQATEHLDDAAGTDAALHVDLQTLARLLVDDSQAFELLAVRAGVEHEIIGHIWFGPVAGNGRGRWLATRRRGRLRGTCKPASFHNRCVRSQPIG